MDTLGENSFVSVIQMAITPVIMLSGVGALMITLTNRMGRVVDRTRSIAGQIRPMTAGPDRAHLEEQLAILWRRANLLRVSVTLAGTSMLLSCLLVMAIFVDAIRSDFGAELIVIFVTSVIVLIGALLAFLRDIWTSLWALRLEVDRAGRH